MEPAFEEGNILLFRKYGKPDRGDAVVVYEKEQQKRKKNTENRHNCRYA